MIKKKRKKEKADDSLPLQGSSEVRSRDPTQQMLSVLLEIVVTNGISSCACAVSFRETGGKGMGTMSTLHVLWTLQSSSDLTLTVSQQSGIDSTLQMRKRRPSKM